MLTTDKLTELKTLVDTFDEQWDALTTALVDWAATA